MSLFYHWENMTVVLLLIGFLAEIKNIRMGSGDFLFLALLSLSIGFQEILWLIQIASGLGILALTIKKDRELAFVPYLSLAYLIVLVFHHTSL
ncbi:prepilin peptidase [Streptococcus pluranimalium]